MIRLFVNSSKVILSTVKSSAVNSSYNHLVCCNFSSTVLNSSTFFVVVVVKLLWIRFKFFFGKAENLFNIFLFGNVFFPATKKIYFWKLFRIFPISRGNLKKASNKISSCMTCISDIDSRVYWSILSPTKVKSCEAIWLNVSWEDGTIVLSQWYTCFIPMNAFR